MRRVLPVVVVSVLAVASLSANRRQAPAGVAHLPVPVASHAASALTADAQNALVARYCATCHSDRGKAGGLSLARFDASAARRPDGELTEKIIKKLRAGMMPPAGLGRGPTPRRWPGW